LGWMQNQNDQSPFTTAQEVGQLCSSGYTVSVTNFSESNYVPNATTANGCTCSWSIYNLLSACSYCVGKDQYTSWNTWITNCGSYTSNTSYLPSGLTISQGIPFWAATNPSTWDSAVFNVTEAADIAAAAHPDVTGGPVPTSTTTTSSASGVSVGSIVGGVLGGIAIIVAGGLIIFCAVRRRRRQRMHTTSIDVPSFNASQPIITPVPSNRNQITVQPSPFGYTYGSHGPVSPYLTLPVHSTTNLAAMSPLVSPDPSGFTSHGRGAAFPLADAADMIAPFLARSYASPPTGKAAEAVSERVMAPPGQRARLNPPPYSASADPGSSSVAATTTTWARKVSVKKKKKRNGSVSGATTYSGHSRTSSATTVQAGPRTEQSQPRAATPVLGTVESVEGAVDGGGSMETIRPRGGRVGVSDQRPPAI